MPNRFTSRIAKAGAAIAAAAAVMSLLPGAAPNVSGTGRDAFVDPTAELPQGGRLEMSDRVYVAPFARLTAAGGHRIRLGIESSVQDNASLDASAQDIVLGDGAVVAHGGAVRAIAAPSGIAAEKAKPEYRNPGIAAIERYMAAHPGKLSWGKVPAFVGINALVDGGSVSDGAIVMHLAMVGPGVVVKSGMKVLPGKRAETQEEADNPSLGKVDYVTEADVAFMVDVVEANAALAGGYRKLALAHPSAVYGINCDPGAAERNDGRGLPVVGGEPTQQPNTGKYKYRIIGDVRIGDIAGIRDGVSIRADEGLQMTVGREGRFLGGNTLHAPKHATIAAGDRVTLKPKAVVHGGSGEHLPGGSRTEIGDGTIVGPSAVVFQSTLGRDVIVGAGSLVTDSALPDGTRIPAGEVWSGGKKLYNVEWEPVQARMLK